MGLRELKAAMTREQIVGAALDLFIEHGYDETTMEQIAERALVGSTTLYRYFPSKDLLLLDPFARAMDIGKPLRARPVSEPLNVALGAAIRQALSDVGDKDGRSAALRRIVDNAPVPRARLFDLYARYEGELVSAIGERMHRPAGDLLVVMTAHITFAVFQVAAETWWAGDHDLPGAAIVDEILRTLSTLDLVIPAPLPSPDAAAQVP